MAADRKSADQTLTWDAGRLLLKEQVLMRPAEYQSANDFLPCKVLIGRSAVLIDNAAFNQGFSSIAQSMRTPWFTECQRRCAVSNFESRAESNDSSCVAVIACHVLACRMMFAPNHHYITECLLD